MLKKIFLSIAFSIPLFNLYSYAETINLEKDIYKKDFNNGKIIKSVFDLEKNKNRANKKYYNFDSFLQDKSLTSEQRINTLNSFIKEKRYLKRIAVLVIEQYYSFTQKQVDYLINSIIETKDISNSYLGYLLFKHYNHITLETKNTLINLLDNDLNNQVYLIASMINNFDTFPEVIKNKYINNYLDKLNDDQQDKIDRFDENVRSESDIFPIREKKDEKDNSEINKILKKISLTTSISLKNYYMNILLLKNAAKLNAEQKVKFQNVINKKELIGLNDSLIYSFIDYMIDLDTREREKILHTISSTKSGINYLLYYLNYNNEESKFDLLNITVDQNSYLKRSMMIQEILFDSYNKILTNSEIKNNPLILISFMSLKEKYTNQSIKYLISKVITDIVKDQGKINNLLTEIITGNNEISIDSKNIITDKLIEKKIFSNSSIWFLAKNYDQSKYKKQILQILEENIDKLASFMIYNYMSFEESDSFFEIISKNEKLDFITSLIILNNFQSINKEKRNKLLDHLSDDDKKNRVSLIYIMGLNYDYLSNDLKNKLIVFSKDKVNTDNILNVLLLAEENLPENVKLELIGNIKPYIKNKENLVHLLFKYYEIIDKKDKNELLNYTKDINLRKIILEGLGRNDNKPFHKYIRHEILKDKNAAWDFLLISVRNFVFDKNEFPEKYPKLYEEIKKRLLIIYDEKIKTENFNIESVFDNLFFKNKVIIYKNWFSFDESLKKEFKSILYKDNSPMGDTNAIFLDINLEENNPTEYFEFIDKMYEILKNNIKNDAQNINKNLIEDLLSDDLLGEYIMKTIIEQINIGKIDSNFVDTKFNDVFLLYLFASPENRILFKDFLLKNYDENVKKEIIIIGALEKSFSGDKTKYLNYLFTLEFLERQKI